MPPVTPNPTAPRRGERRKLETHRRLIEAARRVMADKGVDATTINDITEAADVGQGSFYNHFDSKDGIVAGVIEAIALETKESLERTTQPAPGVEYDQAQLLAARCRLMLRRGLSDPVTGWFIVRIGYTRPDLIRVLIDGLRQQIERGVKSGRFAVREIQIACQAVTGATLAIMHAQLTGRKSAQAESVLAETILRILGLPLEEAARIAALPVR